MRIKRTEVAEREQFVREFFKAEPKATVAKANEAVKGKFGKMMRAVRMYELRAETLAGPVAGDAAPVEPVKAEPVVEAPAANTEVAKEFAV